MRADTTTVTSPHDGLALFVRTWLPDGEAKGVVQLAHGMAEHSARYERFAQALTDAGYAVWIHDHRGHGESGAATPDSCTIDQLGEDLADGLREHLGRLGA